MKKSISLIFILPAFLGMAQPMLALREALDKGVANYPAIQSRLYVAEASRSTAQQAKRDYLPNLVLSAQQDYGTVNGQNGPLYGFGGFGVASSGLPLPTQNWHAAFGALYLANFNWDFFTFGRAKARIEAAQSSQQVSEYELTQEKFQHQVRVATAYLNALAAQRLVYAQEKNLERALIFKQTARVRALNGLSAGVDSSLANAEVSNAKIALIRAQDLLQEQQKTLAFFVGEKIDNIMLDTTLVHGVPKLVADMSVQTTHPALSVTRSRIDVALAQQKLAHRNMLPSLSFFGVIQKRGSGFDANYAVDQSAYTTNYLDGIKPTRTNFLLGVGMVWNLTNVHRFTANVRAQENLALSAQADYQLIDQQLNNQLEIADSKFQYAYASYQEVPVQIQSANDAYRQKKALYDNGLTTIVDLTQTLYALNRAETDRDIAYINVWQALVMKAAASGDISVLTNELP